MEFIVIILNSYLKIRVLPNLDPLRTELIYSYLKIKCLVIKKIKAHFHEISLFALEMTWGSFSLILT
jgi:hypothetical protein